MLWVGGGILLHGLEEMHLFDELPHAVDRLAEKAVERVGALGGFTHWLVEAIGGAITGFIIGGVIVAVIRQLTTHPEKLIVD